MHMHTYQNGGRGMNISTKVDKDESYHFHYPLLIWLKIPPSEYSFKTVRESDQYNYSGVSSQLGMVAT